MTLTSSHLGEKLCDTLEQVGDLGRTAGKKLDEARCGTANALTGSASSVRDAGRAVDELAKRTATRLDSTAAYVRHPVIHLRQNIRRHPAGFVAWAAAAGFLLGFAIRKKQISPVQHA